LSGGPGSGILTRKPLIFPISVLDANFNPQNTICMSPVKIFVRLEIEKISWFSLSPVFK
jgi:hypothetical protein